MPDTAPASVAWQASTPVQTNIAWLDQLDVGSGSVYPSLQPSSPASIPVDAPIMEPAVPAPAPAAAPEAPVTPEVINEQPAEPEAPKEPEDDPAKKLDIQNKLTELENKAKEAKMKREQDNPENWEEVTPEVWDKFRSHYQQMEQQALDFDTERIDLKSQIAALDAEQSIKDNTIKTLQERLKTSESNRRFLESSNEVMNAPDEISLINLKRQSWSDPSWHKALEYLYALSNERQSVTWQDLSPNILQMFNDNAKTVPNSYASDYKTPKPEWDNNEKLTAKTSGNAWQIWNISDLLL